MGLISYIILLISLILNFSPKSNFTSKIQQCMKALPYAIGFVVFLTLSFSLWVHSLPPPPIKVEDTLKDMPIPGAGGGLTFEEALAKQTDPDRKESMKNLFDQVHAEVKEERMKAEENGEEEGPESVLNLDGEEL